MHSMLFFVYLYKTRPPSQIMKKPCGLSRNHIFNQNILKIDRNAGCGDFSESFEYGSHAVKNWSPFLIYVSVSYDYVKQGHVYEKSS